MSKNLIKKTLVFGISILFIGTIITPSISGNVNNMNDIKNVKTRDINNVIQTKKPKPHTTSTTDWWPMFRHDPGNTACSESIAPNTNNLCWKETISEEIYSATPIIYNDQLYISTSSYYFDMFEPSKLTEKTRIEVPDFTEILNDLTTYKDEYTGGVYCLDADTGAELWNYQLYAPNDPLIVDNKVFVTDFNIPTVSSSLYCLNAETGDLIWVKPVGGLVISPTVGADGKIFLGCMDYYTYSGSLKCFDFDGNSLWTYPLLAYEIIYSAPAYCEDKVYFNTFNIYSYLTGRLYCVNAENGNDIWDIPTLSLGSPVCKDDMVFVIDIDMYNFYSKLMCFNAETGVLLWEYHFGAFTITFGTPAVAQDSAFIAVSNLYTEISYLYRISTNGTVIWQVLVPSGAYTFAYFSAVCSVNKVFICPWEYYGYDSTIYCNDIENGNLLWNYTLDYETMAYPSIADERVYIADYFGNIYAFEDALKIKKISGGILCAKAEINNDGASDLTNVSWDIDVVGGIFDIINKHAEGDIPTLQAGKSKTVRAFPVIGLGNVEIEVSVSMPGQTPIKKNLNGLVLGLIVIIKS